MSKAAGPGVNHPGVRERDRCLARSRGPAAPCFPGAGLVELKSPFGGQSGFRELRLSNGRT